MKFIKRHINEGLFKTPAQVAKQREKEAELSDEDIIASVGVDVLNSRIPQVKELLEKKLIEICGVLSEQPRKLYDADTMGAEQLFLIPNLYTSINPHWMRSAIDDSNAKEQYPSPIKELVWDTNESAYIAKLAICDYPCTSESVPENRSLILGKGVGDFVDAIHKVEKEMEKELDHKRVIIRLDRIRTQLNYVHWLNKQELKNSLPFPLKITSVTITNRVDFDKLYDLFSMFDIISGEVTLRTLYIAGENTIASLDDLPTLPFRTHEISFTGVNDYCIPDNTGVPLLDYVGNFKRILDPKNYTDHFQKMSNNYIIHPCIMFDASKCKAKYLEELTNGIITKEYYDRVLKYARPGKRTMIGYNPYTNEIEHR